MFYIDGKCNKIDVKDVYYVPSMRHNLLSVSNITDQNISIEYYKDKAKKNCVSGWKFDCDSL